MVWYSHHFKNFPQYVVIHAVKVFGIVNKAEIDVFLEVSCFFDDLADVGNLISGSSAFSKSSLNIWKTLPPWKESYVKPRQLSKALLTKSPHSQNYGFSSSHVQK